MAWILRGWLVLAISMMFSVPAVAGTVYQWVTDDGVYAYADVLKRIPKRYRSQAEKRSLGSLESYERWTPSDRRAMGTYVGRLASNLERLRALNRSLEPMDPMGTRAPVRVRLSNGGSGAGLDIPVAGEGPVVVEQLHTKLGNDQATRSISLVRQGDSVVAMIIAQDNVRDVDGVPEEDLWESLAERPAF
ncbi:MAG: DUF4124 domain-containing protein [Myxococcota bacterium]|nr:DUF4124 domain-containing protein [Myxococcota bacterium]